MQRQDQGDRERLLPVSAIQIFAASKELSWCVDTTHHFDHVDTTDHFGHVDTTDHFDHVDTTGHFDYVDTTDHFSGAADLLQICRCKKERQLCRCQAPFGCRSSCKSMTVPAKPLHVCNSSPFAEAANVPTTATTVCGCGSRQQILPLQRYNKSDPYHL